jgi:hypothetical protein
MADGGSGNEAEAEHRGTHHRHPCEWWPGSVSHFDNIGFEFPLNCFVFCDSAKLELWPADFDLSVAGLSALPPNTLQEYLRSLTVPLTIISPVAENPSGGNDKKFHALWHLLSSKHFVSNREPLRENFVS